MGTSKDYRIININIFVAEERSRESGQCQGESSWWDIPLCLWSTWSTLSTLSLYLILNLLWGARWHNDNVDSHTCQAGDNGLLLCVEPAINGSNIMQQEPDFLNFHFLWKYVSLYSHSCDYWKKKPFANSWYYLMAILLLFRWCICWNWKRPYWSIKRPDTVISGFISTKKWKTIFTLSSKLNVSSFQS